MNTFVDMHGTVVIHNVDYKLLNEQRTALIEKIWDDKDSVLWGLVEMLDDWYDTYNPLEA